MFSFGRFISVLFALLLIGVGIITLLDNLGLMSIDIFLLLYTFWPAILILIGLYLIVARTRVFRRAKSVFISENLNGVSKADFRIDFGAGELAISSSPKVDVLFEGSFTMKPEVSVNSKGGVTNVYLKQAEWSWFEPVVSGAADSWHVGLTTQARLALTLNTGACRLFINLEENLIDSIALNTGASDVTIRFPKASGMTNAIIKGGAANIRLEIPQGVAGCITYTGALGSFNVDRNRFPRSGSQYASPDYDVAANKINIEVGTGISSVSVV
jgi:predicted membrane protein